MRKILLIVMACVLLSSAAHAQSTVAPSSSTGAQVHSKPEASAQSAELAEAIQLTASAVKLYSEGKYDEALPLYQRALAIREKALGPSHPKVSETLDRYACLKRKLKNRPEAEALERRAAGGLPAGLPGNIGQGVQSDDTPLVEGGVLNGRAISLPKPPYPPEAKEMRATGVVKVSVTIDEKGKVIHACAIEGPSVFWPVTESAAAHALFSPTLLSGQPVKVMGVITYNFVAR